MSRIGKKPIPVPGGVKVGISGASVKVEGPKGKLSFAVPEGISATFDKAENAVKVERAGDVRSLRALHGLSRALIANMIEGVHAGFTKRLSVVGLGYNAKAQGKTLVLNLGFAHPVEVVPPEGITVETPTNTEIVVSGVDKQMVGEFAAKVRRIKRPEPYKGKGIRYADEVVKIKPGKAFVSAGV